MSRYYYGGHEYRNPIECDDISTPAGYFTQEEWDRYQREQQDYEDDRYEEWKLEQEDFDEECKKLKEEKDEEDEENNDL